MTETARRRQVARQHIAPITKVTQHMWAHVSAMDAAVFFMGDKRGTACSLGALRDDGGGGPDGSGPSSV